jgi:hypothetical protein
MEPCRSCTSPPTPLDDEGRCVTCDAAAEGLAPLLRSGYASVRETMARLEEAGLAPEMERVPPARPEERQHPLWNLYVPRDEVPRARELLGSDWAGLLGDPGAVEAAVRGQKQIDLDAGGVVTCPACGLQFTAQGRATECPECGLALGAPSDASPDEAQ